LKKGLIIKSTGSWYSVKDSETGEFVSCNIRGKLRIKGIKSTNPVAVGDIVEYDQAIIMVTIAFPVTYTIFIDRFLITAEAYEIPAKIIFNKTDLYNEKQAQYLNELVFIYESAGYECLTTSVKNKTNIDNVKTLLQNKTSLIAGNSGVGKSSLINLIDSSLDLKTSEISDSHKSGKHTTTFAEMYELSFGGYIIDTPGIRGFGLHDINKEELFHFFPEIFKISKNCKYHNCTHVHEPGCAIKDAVENGIVSLLRYENYLSILFGDESKHRL
jgi:ribosome biogenesis GTPase